METTDKQFFFTFLGITGVLVLLSIVVLLAANWLGSTNKLDKKSAAQIKIAKERIQPVGQVNLKSNPIEAVEPGPTTIVAVSDNAVSEPVLEGGLGKKVYGGICQSCHIAGVAGAPIVGDIAAWKPRIAAGMDELYAAVINGKGLMAARGGDPSLSDEEIRAAVDYMVEASQ